MEGFFVFGFALTTTPVPGASSPRLPLSLISVQAAPLRTAGPITSARPPDTISENPLGRITQNTGGTVGNSPIVAPTPTPEQNEVRNQECRRFVSPFRLGYEAAGRIGEAITPDGIVNLSRGGILLPSVARRFGAEKSLARLYGRPLSRERGEEGRLDRAKLTMPSGLLGHRTRSVARKL